MKLKRKAVRNIRIWPRQCGRDNKLHATGRISEGERTTSCAALISLISYYVSLELA